MLGAFAGKGFVVRVDAEASSSRDSTLLDDVTFLTQARVRPLIVAPDSEVAHAIVRSINRSKSVAVGLSGSDAALLPQTPNGIGRVHAALLNTLLDAGYIPVIEPTAFAIFADNDAQVLADDVASAIAIAIEAARAVFFHPLGGIPDLKTHEVIDEVTAAEALTFADDQRTPEDLRDALRAGALSVRSGVGSASILDGRVAHAAIIDLLTAHHIGTRITSGIVLAA